MSPTDGSISHQDLEDLLRITDTTDFISKSYRRILEREADGAGLKRHARRLCFLPLYTRWRFLQGLLNSEEYRHVQRQHIEKQRQVLARERQEVEIKQLQWEILIEEEKLEKVRQTAELKRFEQKQREDWQTIESMILANHGRLLAIKDCEEFVIEAYESLLGRKPHPVELASGRDRLHGCIDRGKRDFLRLIHQEIFAKEFQQATWNPNAQPVSMRVFESMGKQRCRICGGQMIYKWTCKILGNRYEADYFECSSCQSLQIPEPFWLKEAYETEHLPLYYNPDQGRFVRNISAYNYFMALKRAELVPDKPALLDYGGGYGLFTQMLRSGGYNAWQSDPYVPVPFFAAERCIPNFQGIPDQSFDMIFALEVIEHFTEPAEFFEKSARILRMGGSLLLSTGIYKPNEHDYKWDYLSTEWGQHVTLWSQAALRFCARRFGFQSVGYFPGNDGFCILMSKFPPEILREKLVKALAILRDGRHLGQTFSPWDFVSAGFVKVVDEPLVENPAGENTVASRLERKAS